MRFIDRRRRQPMIPLVNLIDILIILLLFFVMTAEFSLDADKRKAEEKQRRERRLEISLPAISEMQGQDVSDARTAIALTADSRIVLGDDELPDAAALVDALRRARAANTQARFELEPDEHVPLGLLVKVWDALTKAGIPVGDVPARVIRQAD